MNEIIEKLKILLTGKCNYWKTTTLNFFTSEDYPAICFEPQNMLLDNDCLGSDSIEETHELKLHYIEKSDKSRDMTDFITRAEEIAKSLKKYHMIRQKVNIRYKSRDSNDNMEFIAEIIIQGEKI